MTQTTDNDFALETHHVDPVPTTERKGSARDLFALWFSANLNVGNAVFGLVILTIIPNFWLAVAATLVGKLGVGVVAGRAGGFSVRQGVNAGAALVAHGEFTIILAQLAAGNAALAAAHRDDIVAFAGLYVLATATLGVVLMKESKRLGRMLRPAVALE